MNCFSSIYWIWTIVHCIKPIIARLLKIIDSYCTVLEPVIQRVGQRCSNVQMYEQHTIIKIVIQWKFGKSINIVYSYIKAHTKSDVKWTNINLSDIH